GLERPEADDRPLLDHVVLMLERRPVERWVRRVLKIAAGAGMPASPLFTVLGASGLDAFALFAAAVRGDDTELEALAPAADEVLRRMGDWIARPMLQACRRAWASPALEGWSRGDCPVC